MVIPAILGQRNEDKPPSWIEDIETFFALRSWNKLQKCKSEEQEMFVSDREAKRFGWVTR